MKINQQNPKKNKSVSFNTIETIQKQGDSIDKLTLLMNELSSELDRKDNTAQYKPRIHQGRNRGHGQRQNRYGSRIDLIVGKEVNIIAAVTEGTIRMAIIMVIEVIEPEIGIIKQIIGKMTGPIIEGKLLTKIMVKEIKTEVLSREHDRSRPRYRSTSRDNSINRFRLIKVEVGIEEKGQGLHQEKERIDQGLDPAPMLVQIGTGQDAIGAMNMTISLENALTLCWMGNRKQFYNC